MALQDYYERFFILEYDKIPTNYPPPYDFSYTWKNGIDIMAQFILDQSREMLVAGAQAFGTRGRFAVSTPQGAPPENNDILRRESDGILIRLIGESKASPHQSTETVRVWAAEIVDPSEGV